MDLLPLMEQKFSLVDLLSKNPDKIPPIFIARAGMDNPLLNESLDKFITKALANNLYDDVYNHPQDIMHLTYLMTTKGHVI
jgi:hypothetical protein